MVSPLTDNLRSATGLPLMQVNAIDEEGIRNEHLVHAERAGVAPRAQAARVAKPEQDRRVLPAFGWLRCISRIRRSRATKKLRCALSTRVADTICFRRTARCR